MVRVDAHPFERPDLAHHGVGREFGGDGGAAPSDDRQRGQERPQLAHDHHDHELADQVGGADLAQLADRLEMTRKLRIPVSRTTSPTASSAVKRSWLSRTRTATRRPAPGRDEERGDGLKSEARQRAHLGEPARRPAAERARSPITVRPG